MFIPTSLAMSVDIHKMIMRQIESVLNEKGYWTKKQLDARTKIKSRSLHGFDTSKFNAASLFYLPCQAKNPADSFFPTTTATVVANSMSNGGWKNASARFSQSQKPSRS